MLRLAILAILLIAAPAAGAEEAEAGPLAAILEVERSMLEDARERYGALARRQIELASNAARVRRSLDGVVNDREQPDHRRIREYVAQLEQTEAEHAALAAAERIVVARIAEHLERIEALALHAQAQRTEQDAARGLLTGDWVLNLLPTGQRGTVTLRQTGALVSGTYELDGGWSGSLQGTLVNRKVFLIRIDSRLGKSMELEGYLSADGQRIGGSWLNYELAGGDGATGQWSAQRVGQPQAP
jgi:hypothetical protein